MNDVSCSLIAGGLALAVEAGLEAASLGVFSTSDASDDDLENFGIDLPPSDFVSADISMTCPATGGDVVLFLLSLSSFIVMGGNTSSESAMILWTETSTFSLARGVRQSEY